MKSASGSWATEFAEVNEEDLSVKVRLRSKWACLNKKKSPKIFDFILINCILKMSILISELTHCIRRNGIINSYLSLKMVNMYIEPCILDL